MEALKQWAFSVCAAMVACGIAQMVLPRSGMEKLFQITVSVFFLCCLLSPVLLQMPKLDMELQQTSQEDINRRAQKLADVVAEQSDQAAVSSVRKIVRQKLTEMGINYLDITINISTNGQSEQQTIEVDVLLDQSYQINHGIIQSELADYIGLPVHVRYTLREE